MYLRYPHTYLISSSDLVIISQTLDALEYYNTVLQPRPRSKDPPCILPPPPLSRVFFFFIRRQEGGLPSVLRPIVPARHQH